MKNTRLFGLLLYPSRSWRRFCRAAARRRFGAELLGVNVTWIERGGS